MFFKRRYGVKNGYLIRDNNEPFPDVQPTGTIYQPHVYAFAKYLVERGDIKHIIDIGAGSGEKLKELLGKVKITAVDCDTNINLLRQNLPGATVIEYDLEKGLPKLSDELLDSTLVVSSDVIEHIVKPHRYLKGLSKLSKHVPYLLISTPDRTRARGAENFGPPDNPFHVREWAIEELNLLLHRYGIENVIGYTVSNDHELNKATIVALSGTQAIARPALKEKSVLAVMTAYNEEDIIEWSARHLLSQGVDLHIIDNWSTDNTFIKIKRLAREHKGITYERYPKKKPEVHKYEWEKLLQRVENIAVNSEYDWIIHNDADELRLSPWKGVTLEQAVSFIDKAGYSAIDFTVLDFRATVDGYESKDDPEAYFVNFELNQGGGNANMVQVKAWKNKGKVDLSSTGGHEAIFEGRRVFPLKFLSKHYPLRSSEQARKKVFNDRIGNFVQAERSKGWHVQYDSFKKSEKFIWSRQGLNIYTKGNFYDEYFIERLSGVGVESLDKSKRKV